MAVSEMEQGAFGWASGSAAAVAGAGPGAQARGRARKDRPPAEVVRHPPVAVAELPPDNELWDVRAAARFLKRSVSWIYHRAEDGTLPVKRLGGWGLRFVPGELRAWVETGGAAKRR
jgi:predicted DNA-binding transcriptional regulator AlpA